MSLCNRFLTKFRDRLADHRLLLRLRFWDGEDFDFAPAPSVTIVLRSRRLLRWFLTDDMGRLGRAYVEGEIAVEGRLHDVLEIGVTIAERLGKSPTFRVLSQMSGRRRHTVAGDAVAVRYHYDVSEDFYRPWLDRNMVYSCAYFETGEEDSAHFARSV